MWARLYSFIISNIVNPLYIIFLLLLTNIAKLLFVFPYFSWVCRKTIVRTSDMVLFYLFRNVVDITLDPFSCKAIQINNHHIIDLHLNMTNKELNLKFLCVLFLRRIIISFESNLEIGPKLFMYLKFSYPFCDVFTNVFTKTKQIMNNMTSLN